MPRTITRADTKLKCQVDAIYYSCPTFSAGSLKTPTGDTVSFAGAIYAQQGNMLILSGKWIKHPKYGRQFEVASMEYDRDLDANGLANYIAKHPDMKGIGPAKASLIASKFGDNFDHYLTSEPEAIAAAAHISIKTVELLREKWQETGSLNHAMTALSAFELTHLQVTGLVNKLGSSVTGLLQSDPYSIVGLVPGFGFKRIDRIARDKMGAPKETPGRLRAGIIHIVDEALERGDCFVEFKELINRANTLLVLDSIDSKDRIERALDALLEEDVLSWYGSAAMFVGKPGVLKMEMDLATTFLGAASKHPCFPDIGGIEQYVSQSAPSLNDDQHRAVITALKHSITLISGGAGSGKTFTISALVGICQEHDLSVVLAAPTGKAAKRMEEVVGMEAKTIHRLLGYDGRDYNCDNIDADIVIVDEVSMLDVPLAWRLFQAIDLSRTAVVLVGDHNQLPPVGPGNVLRDIIRSSVVPMVILGTVVRQAGVLKENCLAILSGEVRKTSEEVVDGRRAWYVIDELADAGHAQHCIVTLFEKILSERLGFDLIRDVQVLTPTHKEALGTQALNSLLQRIIQKKLWGIDVLPLEHERHPKLYLHDKVMQTRNNYNTGVMNGSVGLVIAADDEEGITIDFDGIQVQFKKGASELLNIQLAYVTSIHKAQGSEVPCSIVVVHKSHSFMHHRNLLYTAVTRASQTVIIVGDHWGINHCAKVKNVEERNTFLTHIISDTQHREDLNSNGEPVI